MRLKGLKLLVVAIVSIMSVTSCGREEVGTIGDTTSEVQFDEGEKNTEENSTQIQVESDIYWEQVGVQGEIATIYNGDTMELQRSSEDSIWINGTYDFEEPADFLQFVEINMSYGGANVRLWVSEPRKSHIELSGDYELQETGQFNDDYGHCYDLFVDGKCILQFDTYSDSLSTAMEDCEIYRFSVYPTEGLVLNGYEFQDESMQGMVNYFGDPNHACYWYSDTGESDILYIYEKDIPIIRATEGMGLTGSHRASSLQISTIDGKIIEQIDISLSLTEDEIRNKVIL